MGWKKYGGGKMYKFDTEGQELEGIWIGSKPSTRYDTRLGMVQTEEGTQVFTLNTAISDLDQLPRGTKVKIKYLGKERSKSGQEFKAYDLFVDEEFKEEEAIEQPQQSGAQANVNKDIPF